jgi:hypothetical protein
MLTALLTVLDIRDPSVVSDEHLMLKTVRGGANINY